MLRTLWVVALLALAPVLAGRAVAQEEPGPLQALLQENAELVTDASRRTVGEVLEVLVGSGLPGVPDLLATWQERELYYRESDGRFYYVDDPDADPLVLIDIDTGEEAGTAGSREIDQLRPNRGVQTVIGSALVGFRLASEEPRERRAALRAIDREPEEDHLPLVREFIETEEDPALRATAETLLTKLVIAFADTEEERIAAIESLSGNISIEARATLNPLLATRTEVAETLPEDRNIARELTPGSEDFPAEDAYEMLVEAELAPPLLTRDDILSALEANVMDGTVGGVPIAQLSDPEARVRAYNGLVAAGLAEAGVTEDEIRETLANFVFYEEYYERNAAITDAAERTLASIEGRVAFYEFVDLSLDGLSLASIYFLAAIGLAITFGVMGVINMAHGEFIMMGAYTGFVVQSIVPNETASIAIAIPLAFVVTFAAGVALERSVIRWLYHRPLETLLATFGISIAVQQIVRQIFGALTQPLSPPDWLAGSVAFNEVVSISSIRIAIFLLGVIFFVLLWLILNKTRLGLEVRAVTQNPRMAASMGINPDRINMLTFGLGSGIAGIAGVAIGLFAQVVPDLGTNYIVQSFMTVVVGGVGNIFGTLAGAALIGFLQKGIEWLNPANTLAAQTYMILFVILFIQFRPRGIIALRGRAAGD
ncbi:urea ABC transporter permease subunit UrtB [Rhodobacterales bacterium HKCCE3408]|nr:urea ABC transporter permease subunit UrtB [Rhodobacterales bacterium HKCCE3408]